MEIAVLLLEQGHTAAVRTVAGDLAQVFNSEGVHQEALTALQLFQRAAVQEALTAVQARRILDYLFIARYNPDLRYDS